MTKKLQYLIRYRQKLNIIFVIDIFLSLNIRFVYSNLHTNILVWIFMIYTILLGGLFDITAPPQNTIIIILWCPEFSKLRSTTFNWLSVFICFLTLINLLCFTFMRTIYMPYDTTYYLKTPLFYVQLCPNDDLYNIVLIALSYTLTPII